MVVIFAVLALSSQRHHQHSHQMRAKMKPVNEEPAIRATGRKVQQAFETKDYRLFRSLLTSNFQSEDPLHHVSNLRESIANVRKALEPMSEIKCDINIQRVTVNGHTAMVDDRFVMRGKMKDKKGMHKMRVEGSETVSLKKVGGQWLAYYDKMHDQSASVDGHVVMHMP